MYLSQLKGCTGTDVDLATSLYEYGLVWKYIKKEDEYRFYYTVIREEEPNKCKFDWGCVSASIDFWEEYSWVNDDDKVSFLNFVGMTIDEFNDQELPYKINDLVSYYGYENVFGSCYDGFSITTNQY